VGIKASYDKIAKKFYYQKRGFKIYKVGRGWGYQDTLFTIKIRLDNNEQESNPLE
jgi:hypothetical protein